jgi:hypothetical protein
VSAVVEVVCARVVVVWVDSTTIHAVLFVLDAAILLGLPSKGSVLRHNFSISISYRGAASLPRCTDSVVIEIVHEDLIFLQSAFLFLFPPFRFFSNLLVK